MSRGNGLTDPMNPTHEGIDSYGVAYSASRSRAMNSEELRRFAAELMRIMSQSCFQRGAKDIGHIKAYIEHDGGFLHANTVGDPADITVEGSDGPPTKALRLTVNAVIYGLDAPAVRAATEETLIEVFEKFNLKRDPKQAGGHRDLGGKPQ